jgi:O-succinylbenzoic acid--CoA ligase
VADLISPLRSVAEQYADQPAFVSGEFTLTWREVADAVSKVVVYLRSEGCQAGDRVALTGQNSLWHLLTILGIIESGSVACPISNRLPAEEQRKLISRLGARLVDPSTNEWPAIEAIAPSPLRSHWPKDSPATIVPTSGSTGQAKLAVLSAGNHYYNALGSDANIPFHSGGRWLLSLPLYHVGGLALLFRSMLHGGALVLARPDQPMIDTIGEHHVTHLSLVSTQLRKLLESQSELVRIAPRLSAVLLGGSPIPAALIDRALETGLPIHTSYGLTEMGSQVCTTAPADPAAKLFTSGQLLPHRELRLAADGEIFVRGDTRFLGYLSDNAFATPFDRGGWFATGDIGEIDHDGYLTIRGRKDNMFVSGGENIHPEEIDAALCRLPEVREAVTVAIPDDEFGYRPVAFVRLADQAPFDDTRFVGFLERFLPRFKIPDEFFPWPDDAPVDAMKPDRPWFTRRANDLLNR